MNNEIRELSFDELDHVSGGSFVSWLVGAIGAEVVHAILNAKDSTPTNVLNGMLGAIGQKPV
jgi:hypothetical protein